MLQLGKRFAAKRAIQYTGQRHVVYLLKDVYLTTTPSLHPYHVQNRLYWYAAGEANVGSTVDEFSIG